MPYAYSNTLPDPFLPLIDKEASSPFTLRPGVSGTVYPQRRDKDDHTHHPSLFYVEFPAGSSRFHQVDAARLARLVGEKLPTGGFTHAQFALILSEIPAPSLFRRILSATKPTQ